MSITPYATAKRRYLTDRALLENPRRNPNPCRQRG
jgi:hypothetical protein